MDRLKREWKETKIPEEVRLRARNLAWAKIQRPCGGRRALGWVAASSAIVAVGILLLIWSERKTRIERVSAPAHQSVSRLVMTENQTSSPHIERSPLPKPIKRHITSLPAKASAEEHERIVLNFKLPESGTRMIWVIDSKFHLDGGVK